MDTTGSLARRRRSRRRWICSITFNAPPKACTVWPRPIGIQIPRGRLLRRQKSAGRELDLALDVLKKLGGRLPEAQAKIVQALHSDLTKIHTTLSEAQSAEAEPQAALLTEGERWTEAITGARDIFRPIVDELNKAALQARAMLEQSMSTTSATVDRVRGGFKLSNRLKIISTKLGQRRKCSLRRLP